MIRVPIRTVFIKFMGTQAGYDHINILTIELNNLWLSTTLLLITPFFNSSMK